ncbi:galactose-specific lectin nattectin-like [Mercenaria mercenaria]|uniref:galactose-specific lectin nattectin-like n=1 Tax=Mercenaria mercenaria TaxID=6596 RepID=UPI00234F04F8|nr:galactose-specific lectin nattectin-like [Mercenaria mercenaria]
MSAGVMSLPRDIVLMLRQIPLEVLQSILKKYKCKEEEDEWRTVSRTVKLFCNLAIFCRFFGLFSCDNRVTNRCPGNLPKDKYLRVHGDKCYRFITSEVSWTSARDHCRRIGGHLISITSRDVQIFVERTLHELWSENRMWIGANDIDSEMDWFWDTGEMVRSGFQNWDSGQPSCYLFACYEDCACLRLDKDYKWHDCRCNSPWNRYGYACQYSKCIGESFRHSDNTMHV